MEQGIIAMGVPAQEGDVSVQSGLLPGRRPDQGVDQRLQLPERDLPARADLIAVDHGQSEMDELLAERDTVNRPPVHDHRRGHRAAVGRQGRGVEIKDVSLQGMKRSMSRQAEAERERRARIITADGEFQASKRLAAAANVVADNAATCGCGCSRPSRREVAAERNSTLVMPIPVELLRFFDEFTPSSGPTASAEDSASMGDFSDGAGQERNRPSRRWPTRPPSTRTCRSTSRTFLPSRSCHRLRRARSAPFHAVREDKGSSGGTGRPQTRRTTEPRPASSLNNQCRGRPGARPPAYGCRALPLPFA